MMGGRPLAWLLAALILVGALASAQAEPPTGEPALVLPTPRPPEYPEPSPDEPELARRPAAAPAADSTMDALGFGAPQTPTPPPPPPPQEWSVYGSLRSDWALWTQRFDSNPLAKSRQSIDLNVRFKKGIFRLVLGGHAEYDFAYLYQRESYDQPTLDSYEWRVFQREALAALSLGPFELAGGYQIVPWGHGELISPLDVAMPRDLREPGLQDAGDLRLPVLSTRLSFFRGAHRIDFMMIHLPTFGLRTPPDGVFSSLPALFSSTDATTAGLSADLLVGRSFNDTTPSFDQQFLLRYSYSGPRVDVAVYAGTLLEQRGVFVVSSTASFLGNDTMQLQHERFGVLGTSGRAPLRGFLLTWELGIDLAKALNVGSFSSGTLSSERAYIVNTMLGLTFTGVRNLRLSLEVLKPWVLNDRDDWLQVPDRPVFAARAAYSFFRERLEFNVVATFIGFQLEQGWLLRGEGSFRIRDGLKIQAGYITYHPGSEFSALYGLDSHDRFYAGLRWDFTLL